MRGLPRQSFGMYFLTVRAEARIPSFMESSAEIRSSPQDGLSRAMARINSRRFEGRGGRPRLAFHLQKIRNPCLCQRISVAGFTTTRAFLQSKNRISRAMRNRVASSARRGLILRSTKSASCFRPGTPGGGQGGAGAEELTEQTGEVREQAGNHGKKTQDAGHG